MRSKQKSQAIVEFGLIAILFTALMFATVDFSLLLNTWLSVSSGTRELARSASVGKHTVFLTAEANALAVPAVDPQYGGTWCCTSTSALYLTVDYFNCVPAPGCNPVSLATVSNLYYGGTCGGGCAHPVSDDVIRVTLVAQGAQIITPLLRPAFGCTNGNNPKCYVPLRSTAIIRFEGTEF